MEYYYLENDKYVVFLCDFAIWQHFTSWEQIKWIRLHALYFKDLMLSITLKTKMLSYLLHTLTWFNMQGINKLWHEESCSILANMHALPPLDPPISSLIDGCHQMLDVMCEFSNEKINWHCANYKTLSKNHFLAAFDWNISNLSALETLIGLQFFLPYR